MVALQAGEVGLAELVPLGDEQERVGALRRGVRLLGELDAAPVEDLRGDLGSRPDRARAPSRRSPRSPSITVIAGASRMSSVFGLNASPHTAMVFPASEPKCFVAFSTSQRFWRSFTRSTERSRSKSRPTWRAIVIDRADVLREAGAAEPDAGEEERVADAPVRADAAADLVHVGAEPLAERAPSRS